jgi:hypothetical protein
VKGAPVKRLALTRRETAESLGVSVDYVSDHIWSELRIVRRGRCSLVAVTELQRWLDAQAQYTIPPLADRTEC